MKTYDASMAPLFRATLTHLASQLGATLQAEAHADEAAGRDVSDLKDVAASEMQTWLADSQARHASGELDEIRAALARIRDGSYGLCVDCGDPIDVRRLAAMPAAARCAACQEAREHPARERL